MIGSHNDNHQAGPATAVLRRRAQDALARIEAAFETTTPPTSNSDNDFDSYDENEVDAFGQGITSFEEDKDQNNSNDVLFSKPSGDDETIEDVLEGVCTNDPTYRDENGKDCEWIGKHTHCNRPGILEACPGACLPHCLDNDNNAGPASVVSEAMAVPAAEQTPVAEDPETDSNSGMDQAEEPVKAQQRPLIDHSELTSGGEHCPHHAELQKASLSYDGSLGETAYLVIQCHGNIIYKNNIAKDEAFEFHTHAAICPVLDFLLLTSNRDDASVVGTETLETICPGPWTVGATMMGDGVFRLEGITFGYPSADYDSSNDTTSHLRPQDPEDGGISTTTNPLPTTTLSPTTTRSNNKNNNNGSSKTTILGTSATARENNLAFVLGIAAGMAVLCLGALLVLLKRRLVHRGNPRDSTSCLGALLRRRRQRSLGLFRSKGMQIQRTMIGGWHGEYATSSSGRRSGGENPDLDTIDRFCDEEEEYDFEDHGGKQHSGRTERTISSLERGDHTESSSSGTDFIEAMPYVDEDLELDFYDPSYRDWDDDDDDIFAPIGNRPF